MKHIKQIFLFNNGNFAVFDSRGKQVTKLQLNVLVSLFEYAKVSNYKIDEKTEITLPNGMKARKLKNLNNFEVLE
jgi:hypothetical protein